MDAESLRAREAFSILSRALTEEKSSYRALREGQRGAKGIFAAHARAATWPTESRFPFGKLGNVAVSFLQRCKYWYLCNFAKPAVERVLYKKLKTQAVQSIVEIGVGQGERITRLTKVMQLLRPDVKVRYTGIDLFEGRAQGAPGLELREAHRRFSGLGLKVQLAPGDAYSALARLANSLTGTDWVFLSADQDPQAVTRAMKYLPRMLGPDSIVFVEERSDAGELLKYQELRKADIEAKAATQARAERRAA
jgi:predicted O-methyltransferase YrrM